MYSFLSTKQNNEKNLETSDQNSDDDVDGQKCKIDVYLKLLYEAEVRRILNCHFIPFTVRRRYATLSHHRNQTLYEHRVLLRICDHFQQMNAAFIFMSSILSHFIIPRLSGTSQKFYYISFIVPLLRKAEIFLHKYPFRHDFYERLLRYSIKRTIKEESKDPYSIMEEEMALPFQITWDFIKEQFSIFSMFVLENVELSDNSNNVEIRQMYKNLQNHVPELEELFDQNQSSYDNDCERKEHLNNDELKVSSKKNIVTNSYDQDNKENTVCNAKSNVKLDDLNERKILNNNVQQTDVGNVNYDSIDDNSNKNNNDNNCDDNYTNNTNNSNFTSNNTKTDIVNIHQETEECINISNIGDNEAFSIDLLNNDYFTIERLKQIVLLSPYIYEMYDFPHFINEIMSTSSCGSSDQKEDDEYI